jgi:Amt family ammonium transporter
MVESEPGKGSTFTITVPTGCLDGVRMMESPADLQFHIKQDKLSQADRNSTPLTGCRVLLAEDGLDNQRLISFILKKKLGAEVAVAEDGRIALELVAAAEADGKPFDLILMDMQMPVMDGYQATQYLRSKGWSGPIIALTAHAMVADRQKCLDAGCTDYLAKPIDRDRFAEVLTRHIVANHEPGNAAEHNVEPMHVSLEQSPTYIDSGSLALHAEPPPTHL